MCAGDHERVEWMERTKPDESDTADVEEHAHEIFPFEPSAIEPTEYRPSKASQTNEEREAS